MDFKELAIYANLFMTVFLVLMLYVYIIVIYRIEKNGEKDYEKYGKIALDDEIDSQPIEKNLDTENKKEE
ncbi:MAG: cytochrome c oxidase, cbb3-type, CcoQ subunit [Sulfurovaceae bacterium]